MLRLLNCYHYHTRKPRVITEEVKSFINYRKKLREARRKVYIDAHLYQEKIQDQYLQNHKQQMRNRHFNNQALFRNHIAQSGYILSQNTIQWQKDDQQLQQKVQKYITQQQLKRINRERIKKILEYESQNYWFNGQNVDSRMKDQTIFPNHLSNSQFYYKLHLQALAYQTYDFNYLEKISANDIIIKQKNQLLIPLYKQVLKYAVLAKNNPIAKTFQDIELNLGTIKQEKSQDSIQMDEKLEQLKNQHKKLSTQTQIKRNMKEKLAIITHLIKSWQEYTSVLGLGSAQILDNLKAQQREPELKKIRNQLMEQSLKLVSSGFISIKEEESQDLEISFKQYIEQIKQQLNYVDTNKSPEEKRRKLSYIESLIEDEEVGETQKDINSRLSLKNNTQKNFDFNIFDSIEDNKLQIVNIPQHLRIPSETTITVQVLKSIYKHDKQIVKVLNEIGQAKIQYPKLFKRMLDIV